MLNQYNWDVLDINLQLNELTNKNILAFQIIYYQLQQSSQKIFSENIGANPSFQARILIQQLEHTKDIQERLMIRLKVAMLYQSSSNFEMSSTVLSEGYHEILGGHFEIVDKTNLAKQQLNVSNLLEEKDKLIEQLRAQLLEAQTYGDKQNQARNEDIVYTPYIQTENIKYEHQFLPPCQNTDVILEKIDLPSSPQLFILQPRFRIKTISSRDKYGVYEYDGNQLQKVAVLPFHIERWPACVMLEDESLFICGGLDYECTCILTPENEVQRIPKMNQISSISAIVKVEQRIYVFGGYRLNIFNDYQYLANASYYDLQCNRWVDIKKLPNKRSGCGAAYYNGFIYVGGGKCDDDQKHTEILKYDLERDEYFPTSMTFSKSVSFEGSSLFVVQNRLYCLKGIEMRVYNLDSEEHFNTLPIPEYSWWSNFPPAVIGDEAYMGNTWNLKFRKVNFNTGVVTEIGNLNE